MLLAASTGIVGATVVTMGLLSLPTMLKRGYDVKFSTGIICATGTLGQIIPPSIALVLLGDVLSSAYQKAQLDMGIFSPETVSVGDLFAGAVIPGFILVLLYMAYCIGIAIFKPEMVPSIKADEVESISEGRTKIQVVLSALIPPLLLMFAVLGCYTNRGCRCWSNGGNITRTLAKTTNSSKFNIGNAKYIKNHLNGVFNTDRCIVIFLGI